MEQANQTLTLSRINENLMGLHEEMYKTKSVCKDTLNTLAGCLPPEPECGEEKQREPVGALEILAQRVDNLRRVHTDIFNHTLDIQRLIG